MQRKSVRLKKFDYSQNGYYFITICTKDRKNILSDIAGDGAEIKLSEIGKIALEKLLDIESHYDNIKIDKYVIMPNHIHLIVRITERINALPTIAYDIPNIIGKYKAAVTRTVGNAFMHSEKPLWQKSFYDHIIRDENDYIEICRYITENPYKWELDKLYTKK